MKQLFIFIAGMVTGAFLLFLIFLFLTFSVGNVKQDIQYVEVKGKKGITTLHTGMPKDSVQILVGKPDKVTLRSIGNSTYESWGYKIKNKYLSDLDIEFENGKLKVISEN